MADNSVDSVSLQCEQRIVIKFLVKEGTPVVEIVKRLKAVFAEDTLSISTIYEWAKRFKEGRTSVDDDKRAGAPRTAVTRDNITAVDLAIKENRRISVLELSSNIGVSAGSIDTIIHEHLLYSKVTARWVPKMLTEQHKQARVSACQQLLDRFSAEGETFLERIVTGDETWVHHYTPETKRSSMQWKHVTSPSPRKFRVQRSAGKVMATVFWDIKGVLLLDFLERNHTVTGQHYSDQLEEQLHPSIRSKRRGLLSKGVMLQHDNARAHTANVTSSTITKLGWEVLVHPPYSPDLAPSDYHLFGPLKDHLGGMKFDTNDDVKNAVQNWLHIMPETFFSAGIRALPTRWKKCIEVQGDYVEK